MASEKQKRYWKSLRERKAGAEFMAEAETEFIETPLGIQADSSRRGFLKAAGFTFAGAVFTGCRQAPVQKAMPYLIQPEDIVAGRACYYASTCSACTAACGLLVKTRDGRPIKLEGNPDHPVSRGGLCAVGQASILGLYDSLRLKSPAIQGKPASWSETDTSITARLESIRRDGGAVRYLSETITSPTKLRMIGRFLNTFKDARHVIYDPLSCSEILEAHELTHGVRTLPHYDFGKAGVIVSFDADFLGAWISPVEFTRDYGKGRVPDEKSPRLSYHVQFESRMSITGSNADKRIRVSPDDVPRMLKQLAIRLAKKSAAPVDHNVEPSAVLDEVAERLWQARGRSLIVCGVQDGGAQLACNFANHLLGNYGSTVDIDRPSLQKQGNDRELQKLLEEIARGRVAALFVDSVNPAYELPDPPDLRRVPLVVSFAQSVDETASEAHYICPDHHYLETWSDAEPVRGVTGLTQPVVRPLGNTRSVIESIAAWMGTPKSAYDLLRENWETRIFPRQNQELDFQRFWDRAVQNGYVQLPPASPVVKPAFNLTAVLPALEARKVADSGFSLALYPKVAMLDGRHAHNPWLQELPDPITKITWDNYACLSPASAARLGLAEGDVVRIEAEARNSLELPVVLQPGQHDNVVAVALGYGRRGTERFSRLAPRWLDWRPSSGNTGLVGKNAAPLLQLNGGALRYFRSNVKLTRTGAKQQLAGTQDHNTLTVPRRLQPAVGGKRPIIQETTLPAFQKDVFAGAAGPRKEAEDLWPQDHPYTGHRWGMAIDLNACTGCSACVIACQVENNIPVAGKDEVRRKRAMHWIRLDRYYSGTPDSVDVAHQPMLCQQCNHAPCETVCPVLATVHSEEGLNQQIYNRCVGTRYCENNCPYKVRRFNWFDYPRDDRMANMVLNPDVTVRSRGVMEKCSFCVQRIQEAKLEAKRRGEPLSDGGVQTACQQSCPAQAIVFGDMNDPKSRISQLMKSGRLYRVLEEINVQPSVGYLRLVRNRPEGEGDEQNG